MERQYDDYADYMERRDNMRDGDGVSIALVVDGKEVYVNATIQESFCRYNVIYECDGMPNAITVDPWSKGMAIALINAFDEATAYEVYNQLKND